MKHILKDINRLAGVRGSIIVDRDGVLIAANVQEGINEEGVAAVASTLVANLDAALDRLKLGNLVKFVLTGTKERAILLNAGSVFIVVLMDKETNLGQILLQLREAADKVKETSKIS